MTCLQPEDRRESAEFPRVVCWLPAIPQQHKIKGSTGITTLTLFTCNKILIFTWDEIVWYSEAAWLQWQETNEMLLFIRSDPTEANNTHNDLAKGDWDCLMRYRLSFPAWFNKIFPILKTKLTAMFPTTKIWEVLIIRGDKISVPNKQNKNPTKIFRKHCDKTDPFPLPLIQSTPY